MEKWEHFFETGELHCPNPDTEPDAFWNGEEFLAYLKKTTLKPQHRIMKTGMHIIILEFLNSEKEMIKLQKKCMRHR